MVWIPMDSRRSHECRVLDAVIVVEVERHLWMASHLIDLPGCKAGHDPDRYSLCGISCIDWAEKCLCGANSWLASRVHGDNCDVRVSGHQRASGGENG